MAISSIILLVLTLTSSYRGSEAKECIPRDYGEGGTVCVCNATYCDTVPQIQRLAKGMYMIYTSSKDGLRFSTRYGNFTQQQSQLTDNLITINPNSTQQTMLGWGGAFTDSSGINIKSLNSEAQQFLLRSLFGKDGIEYSLCRVPIAGTDFSTRFYTYDDVKNDGNLTYFNLTMEDYDYKIPFMKEALKLSNNNLRFFASAWSSPTWMKTNDAPSGFGFLKSEYYQTWAEYHLKFLEAYKDNGIEYWGITTGNEPVDAFFPFLKINVLGWFPWSQGSWIANDLGPLIRNSSFSKVKIIALDDQRILAPIWVILETLFNNALSYIDGFGVHWYLDTLPDFLWLQHLLYSSKFILGTEACTGGRGYDKPVSLGSWERGEEYAQDIFEDVNQWATGWVEWNIALNLEGGPTYIENFVDSSIIVNETAQEFYKQPMHYVMGHFSKFVPPDSVKITSDINTNSVQVLAFQRPDNGTSVIIYNKQNQNVTINLYDTKRGYMLLHIKAKSINSVVYY